MAVPHQTVAYDVNDFKVYALETDSVGGSPTYGAAVDVPGIASVSFSPNLVTAELKGDATIIAKKGRVDKLTGEATYGRLALDVLEVILGGTATDPGADEARYEFIAGGQIPYFKAAFKIEGTEVETGVGDLHVIINKCQLSGGTLLTQASDQFGQPTFQFDGVAPLNPAIPMAVVRLLADVTALDA